MASNTNSDIADLLQLAQLYNVISSPGIDQQRVAQDADSRRLQMVLSLAGLQQQAAAEDAMMAFRQQEAERAASQFATQEANAMTRFNTGTAAEDARANRSFDLQNRGLGLQEKQLGADEAYRNAALGMELTKIMSGNTMADRDLAMREKLSRDQLNAQIYGMAAQSPYVPPEVANDYLRNISPDFAAAGDKYAAGRTQKQVSGLAPMLGMMDDPTFNATISTLSPAVQEQLKTMRGQKANTSSVVDPNNPDDFLRKLGFK